MAWSPHIHMLLFKQTHNSVWANWSKEAKEGKISSEGGGKTIQLENTHEENEEMEKEELKSGRRNSF